MDNETNTNDMDMNENANTDTNANASTSGNANGKSADDVKQRVKETVSKGVAAVAGALKGFSEQAEKEGLAESTKNAIQKAGETTRTVAGTAQKEFQQTKEHIKTKAGSANASASNVGSTTTGDSGPQMGMGGSQMGSTQTPSTDLGGTSTLPDLRKADVAKTDAELEE